MRRTPFIVALALVVVGSMSTLYGQSETQLKTIMGKIKNYRYGNVSIFKLDDITMKAVTELLNPQPVITDAAQKCAPAKQTQIDDKVLELGCAADLPALMEDEEVKKLLRGECIEYAKYSIARKQWECNTFKRAYVITTRYTAGVPFKVVGFITSNSDNKKLTTVLGAAREVVTYTELRNQSAPAGSPAKNLYQYFENFVVQQNASEGVNVTAEAQGIGDEVFIRAIRGLSKLVDEQDVQMYKRISEGQAMNYNMPNELIVSPDLISWKNYEPQTEAGLGSDSVYNRILPKYGVELRYGIESVNVPSFFSDRVSLNAVWGWNKLGVILPTNGWASIGKDLGMTPKLTHAGFGIDGSFDFPIDITNSNTGVFNISGSYVFGDAVQTSGRDNIVQPYTTSVFSDTVRKIAPDTVIALRTVKNQLRNDYLMRINAQLHYSFAVSIDSGNFFRFRIGGALYSRETWTNEVGTTSIDTLRNGTRSGDTSYTMNSYKKSGAKTVGGVSIRMDYMSMYVTTPYGFTLQYFDDALMAQAWLLMPLSPNLGIRFDGTIVSPILREAYEWENASTFVPSLRVIYNF
ncbi:MAG: hypothetical protein RL156_629 [Bacteroidota bacterium]